MTKKRKRRELKEREKKDKRDLRKNEPVVYNKNGWFYKTYSNRKKAVWVERLNRERFFNVEFYILLLKIIIHTKYIENQCKALAVFYMSKFSKRVSICRHKNVCLITGHRRSVFFFARMNRVTMRERINTLCFPGIALKKW